MISARCSQCAGLFLKIQTLAHEYQMLLAAKQEELQAAEALIAKLEKQLKWQKDQTVERSKVDTLQESQAIISYLKDRQIELLDANKQLENQLFVFKMQPFNQQDDQLSFKQRARSQSRVKTTVCENSPANGKSQNRLYLPDPVLSAVHAYTPIKKSTENMFLTPIKEAARAQNAADDKLLSALKHRMALLRAAQYAILK